MDAAAHQRWREVKRRGTKLGDNFTLSIDGKIVRDEAKIDSKLDLCTKLKRRSSKRVRVIRPVK